MSCASYTQLNQDMRNSFYQGNYRESQKKLDDLDIKDNKETLLYHLEKSSIATQLGQHQEARSNLNIASDLVDQSYTKSASEVISSFFINESSQSYTGEDYEHTAIHTMSALSWLEDQNIISARVEAKRINQRLNFFKDQNHSYYQDGFAWMLSGLIFEANNDDDSALIDYMKAFHAYKGNYKKFAPQGLPKTLLHSLYALAYKKKRIDILKQIKHHIKKPAHTGSSVVVIQRDGNIAIKKSKEFITVVNEQAIRFSFPYIALSKSPFYPQTQITIAGKTYYGETAVDFNALAHNSLEDRRTRLLAKGFARVIAKANLVQEARKSFGPIGGFLANIITAATETADTRSWSLLPQYISIKRIWLPLGEHTVQIKTKIKTLKQRVKLHQKGQIFFIQN